MPATGPGPSPPDPALDRLIEEITRKLQAREPIDLEAYRRLYPALMGPLGRLLPALLLMDYLGDGSAPRGKDDAPPDPVGS
jgi:hypothetical protein